MYHISDRDERFEDEYEEGGSRSYPSRTTYGEAWAIGEKHPNLMASKSFLWGLISIPMYEYRCVLTCAQIELLTIDKPVVNYGINKSKGGKRDRMNQSFKRPSKQLVMNKTKEWEEKYKDGSKPVIDLSQFVIKK